MQTPPDLRWDDVQVLLALHRRGSLKRAADDLAINISTVSRRLDALEASVGHRLFDRTPEGTRPTAASEQLLPFAEMMERAAVGIAHGLEAFEIEPEGEVRITAPPGIVEQFLAPALVELLDAYPRLRISILSSIGYADLTRREADIALRTMRPAAGDFVSTRVAQFGWRVVGSPKTAAALGRLSDPNRTRWITWGEDLAALPDYRWIQTNVDPLRIVLTTSSMTGQLQAVRSGLGVTLAPEPYVRLPDLAEVKCAPKLRTALAGLPDGNLWLVGHRALREVPRVAAVWSWLKSSFAGV